MNELCNRIFDKLTYKDKNGVVYSYLKRNRHAKDLLNEEEYNYFISRKSNFLTEYEILYAIKNDLYKRPVCEICGEPVKYYGIANGFRKTCKNIQCWKLSAKRNSDAAFIRNHPGYINPGQVPEIREKVKDTCRERYGYDNILESPEIREAYLKIFQEHYGEQYINPGQVPEIRETVRKTVNERYGVDNVFQAEEIKAKIIQTCLEKYGYMYASQSPEVRQKVKETCLERYGVEATVLLDWIRDLALNSVKAGGPKSKSEDIAYERIMKIFPDTKRHYRDKRYSNPINGRKFECDFYIPSKDLFIEAQFSPAHGTHPYDENDPKDKVLANWLKQHPESYFKGTYSSFVISDPMKREVAKKNKLNYIEFWTLHEVNKWLRQFLNSL